MSTKSHVLKLIDSYADEIIKDLCIEHCSIKWHVYHSEDPELIKKGFSSKGCVAVTIWNSKKKFNKTYDIVIYHDKHTGRKDIIGSIVHELLHVRMRQFDRLIKKTKKAKDRQHLLEEKLVRDIEGIFLALI